MIIKADLHTHTTHSIDGRQDLSLLTQVAHAQGIRAVAITDHGHFSPLPEEMNGVLLIPGCEFNTDAGHITGLFLETAPALCPMTGKEAVAEIHRCGGIAILAHPFQKPSRTEEELAFPVDAIETANARAAYKNPHAHDRARDFAQKRALPCIGGSDAHSAKELGNAYTEISCDDLSIADLKKAILRGDCSATLKRDTPRRMIGLSQWARRKRMGGLKNRLIGMAYLMKCVLKDLF